MLQVGQSWGLYLGLCLVAGGHSALLGQGGKGGEGGIGMGRCIAHGGQGPQLRHILLPAQQ